jgi:hypothetical protein
MLPSLAGLPSKPCTDALAVRGQTTTRGAATALAIIESELIEAGKKRMDEEDLMAPSLDPAAFSVEPFLSTPHQRVLGMLREIGIPLDLRASAQPIVLNQEAVSVFQAFLESNALTLLADEKSGSVRLVYNLDEDATDLVTTQSDGTLLDRITRALEETSTVSYEFSTRVAQTYRELHLDPEISYSADPNTFWRVIPLENFNRNAASRRERGYEEHLRREFPHPFVLNAAPFITASGLLAQGQQASMFTILDDNHPEFRQEALNAVVNTSSQWPRLKTQLLAPAHAHTLLGCCRTRLLHYRNAVLMFHGCLRNSAESINEQIDFSLSRRGSALGPGFYLSSNLNESKSYALARVNQARQASSSGAAGSSSATRDQLNDLNVVTILAVLITNAHEIIRTSDQSSRGKTFVLNVRPRYGNQVVLHEGCRPHLRIVQIHDVDCRGEVYSTNIVDSAHHGQELRGVAAARS